MQISPGGLHSWMQLSPAQRVLKASSCKLETTSLSSLNITAYSGVSPFHVHSTYTLLFVIISGFFRSPNSSKSLKQINAGILLDKVLFVLETASHSTMAKKQIYRPNAFHWNCNFCSLFHFSFSIFNPLT